MCDPGVRFAWGKHHGRAPRLRGHRPEWGGWYFLTICVAGRLPLLGAIQDRQMVLSEAGHLVEQAWRRSLVIRAEVTAGPWVVMPDHFHALAHIAPHPTPFPRQPVPGAGGRVPRSISTLIAGFKAASTGAINRHRGCVGARFWQAGFYDRMVRDTDAWRRIAAYIRDNPARWMA